ncbi:MAG TPA: AsmA-like C-terminal region-containing protein [Chthoniobacteraceae bacterium]|nr:AsmA-like C-terminal region-containing protein [Chthoniobacteraceae bacterium]
MKKLSKAILIALAAVLVLVLAVVFGVNLYIQSPGVQARIQEGISGALRVPLKITNTSVTPWGDLRITGITVPNGDANLLEAAAFRAHHRFLPIFAGRLVISDMSVDSPKIVWPQNADGKWELPPPGQAAAKSAAAALESSPQAVSQPAAESKPREAKPKKSSGFQVVVEGFEIKHGNVELLDAAKQRVASFADVNMRYTTLTAERVEGTASIGRLEWAQTFTFENVRTPFSYTAAGLDLPQMSGTIGGGPFTASFNLKSDEPQSPFLLGMKFDEVDLAHVATAAGWAEGQASGTLGGTLDLHGNFPRFSKAEGAAHLTLRDGRFHEFSYFEMIGQALQIRQLSDLRLKDSSADATIADERIQFQNLTLDASDLQLTAKGTARFDGKLQLNARLIAQNALIKQLPSLVRDNFAAGENDTRYIDFNITGKAAKPKTDLLDKIVGTKLQAQFDDLVNGLFGTKRKKEDDKPKDETKKSEKKKKKKDEPDEVKKPAAENPAAPSAAAAGAQ